MQGYIVVIVVLLLLVLYPAGEGKKEPKPKIDSFCANRNKRNFCGFNS